MGLRLATITDSEAMHRLRLAVLENRLADPSRVQVDDYLRMLTTDGQGWVYDVDAEIVGFSVADRVRRNIWALFVMPGYEGRGIGRSLRGLSRD
jgi:hypothetical protein